MRVKNRYVDRRAEGAVIDEPVRKRWYEHHESALLISYSSAMLTFGFVSKMRLITKLANAINTIFDRLHVIRWTR